MASIIRSSSFLNRTGRQCRHFSVLHHTSLDPLEPHDTPDPTPLVILHGLFGSSQNWRSLARHRTLSQNRKVHILDARNHGKSFRSSDMNYEHMADDIKRFLDSKNIAKCFLLGHSMGGKASMAFALSNPSRVSKLVVVDIAPVSYFGRPNWNIPKIISAMRAVDLNKLTRRAEADAILEPFMDHRTRLFILTNLAHEIEGESSTSGVWKWRVNLDAIEKNLEHIGGFPTSNLKPYPHQCLFIRGLDSRHVAAEHHPRIKELFPKAMIHGVANAGHWLHSERPAEFMAAVDSYLNINTSK